MIALTFLLDAGNPAHWALISLILFVLWVVAGELGEHGHEGMLGFGCLVFGAIAVISFLLTMINSL